MKVWQKIFIGLFLGIIAGFVLGEKAEFLKPIGSLFLSLINMVIPLLVLSSMAVGVTSIHDPKKMGRVGLKTLSYYFLTTLIGASLGIIFTYLFSPGTALTMEMPQGCALPSMEKAPTAADILFSIVPSNPILSLVEGNIIQIIFFALFLGMAINFAGEKGKPFLRALESLSEVMYSMTNLIIAFSPFGIFAIMAWVSGTFGFAVILPLSQFLFVFYIVAAIHLFGVFGLILKVFSPIGIVNLCKGMREAILMGLSTCSSSATLPVSMSCIQNDLGVSKNISGFMLPLGATVNMNGTAIFQASAAIFIAQSYNVTLSFTQIATIVLTATLSAIGTAGIPGAGMIMLAAVVSSVGLPIEGIVILACIDRVREMGATVLNVLGDAVGAVCIAYQEKELRPTPLNNLEPESIV